MFKGILIPSEKEKHLHFYIYKRSFNDTVLSKLKKHKNVENVKYDTIFTKNMSFAFIKSVNIYAMNILNYYPFLNCFEYLLIFPFEIQFCHREN